MPVRVLLLALAFGALLGGAPEAWADVVTAETHETAPPVSEVPTAEAEEEEADRPGPSALAEVVGGKAVAQPTLEAQSPPAPPSTPPPRR